MSVLGRGAVGSSFRTGSILTGVGGQMEELCRGNTGQVLTVIWDGTLGWTDPTPAGPEVINDLKDVNAPSPKCGQMLYFNGIEWVPTMIRRPAREYFMSQL